MRQFDVETAFLLAPLPTSEVIRIRPPAGFHLLCEARNIPFKQGQLIRAVMAWYGLKTSPRHWNKKFSGDLKNFGFKQLPEDLCVFRHATLPLFVGVVVDDLIAVGESSAVAKFEAFLKKAFPIKCLGEPRLFCGIQVVRVSQHEIRLNQSTYARQTLERFYSMDCKSADTPAVKIQLDPQDTDLLPPDVPFRGALGSLLWISGNTRPDICYAVNQVCRVAHKPTKAAWAAVIRIFRYLRGTLEFALVYKRQQNCFASIDSDSNWAGNQFTRMTTGGGDYFIGNSLILWKCKTMKEIFTSTFHAESAFISFMGKIGSWLVPLTKQIFDGAVDGPVVLYNDNQSAISSIMEGKTTERTRHIAIKFLYAHELVASNLITLAYRSTDRLCADIYTKAFEPQAFKAKLQNFGDAFYLEYDKQ